MKVYVVAIVWQRDSGENGVNVETFDTIEKAQTYFKGEMVNARLDFSDLECEESEYADGDMSWSCWETGEYCYNHIDLVIYEKELR